MSVAQSTAIREPLPHPRCLLGDGHRAGRPSVKIARLRDAYGLRAEEAALLSANAALAAYHERAVAAHPAIASRSPTG